MNIKQLIGIGGKKYKVVIYPEQGNGLGTVKTTTATLKNIDGENKLKVKGYKTPIAIPDNRFRTGNSYTLREVELDELIPHDPHSKERGYTKAEKNILKQGYWDALSHRKEETKNWLKEYGIYVGMITFAVIILVHQIYTQETNAKIASSAKQAVQSLEGIMENKKDVTAMEQGYYEGNKTQLPQQNPQQQKPPDTG